MGMRKMILGLLLTATQRMVIVSSLSYSRHRYQKAGNMEGYSEVDRVLNELEGDLTPSRKYTSDEVRGMVRELIEKSARVSYRHGEEEFDRGRNMGISEGFDKGRESMIEDLKRDFAKYAPLIGMRCVEIDAATLREELEKSGDTNAFVGTCPDCEVSKEVEEDKVEEDKETSVSSDGEAYAEPDEEERTKEL